MLKHENCSDSTLIMSAAPDREFPLWPQGAPGALGETEKDIPTLTPFFPAKGKATGASLLIFPGGGYRFHAEHEGKGFAEFFIHQGITCFVLKYRLGSDGYRHPRMLEDAARAVRFVRSHSEQWGLDPHRIGVMGSSAGGHLVSAIITHFDAGNPAAIDLVDRASSRPDLAILCYAVISLEKYANPDTQKFLLGENPAPELIRAVSNDNHATSHTPPCFIWHTEEDNRANVENSLAFAMALRKAGVPFDLHIYQKGVHGIGLGTGATPGSHHPWVDDCLFWLKEQEFVK